MKLLSLNQFLKLFHKDNKKYTLNQFVKKARVRIGNKLEKLLDYAERKNIRQDMIKVLYLNIMSRDDYLTRFYNLSLNVNNEDLDIHNSGIPPMKNREMNNNIHIKFKNIIRNLHFFDILQNTESGLINIPTYLNVALELYNDFIIDYKLLSPSALFYISNGRIGSVLSSYYFRASILNPYLIYSLNKTVLHGERIFSPTLGWSSYCYGFLECPSVTEYVGTDVIPGVCKKTKEFASIYNRKLKIDIYCKPSEDLYVNTTFMKKYKNNFDTVFFSPPYYELELYKGENQSTNRYKTYEEWLLKYWEPTIKLCEHVLESKGKLCYILSGYGSSNISRYYDLIKDMNNITKKYFRLVSTQLMDNKNVNVTKHRETGEKIMIFTKKTS